MKAHPIRFIQLIQRGMPTTLSLAAAVLMSVVFTTRAAPVFPMPDPFAAHPGFGINLPPTGPGFLPPGGALGPVFFTDTILSPDVGHWELELNNTNAFAIAFNVTFMFPGGPVFGGLTLPAGFSGYFDIGFLDAPPEVSPPLFWSVSAFAAPGAPIGAGITIDTDVIETPFPTHPPGLAFFASGPGPGAVFGAPVAGPGVIITLVPEPSTLVLLGAGLVGLVSWARMRKKNLG